MRGNDRGGRWGIAILRRAQTNLASPEPGVLLKRAFAPADAKRGVQGEPAFNAVWTDNVLSAPDNPTPMSGSRPRESDFFFRLRPGIIITTGTARAIEQWTDVFSADLFVNRREANSYSDRL